MEADTYSEQDLQDYANGKFTGNIKNFEAYLQRNPALLNQVKDYENLYSLLNTNETPSLSYSLADKVVSTIRQQEYKKEAPKFNLLPYILMLITGLAFFITFRFLDIKQTFSSLVDAGLFLTSAAVMILFFLGFYYVEINQKQKRFASWAYPDE